MLFFSHSLLNDFCFNLFIASSQIHDLEVFNQQKYFPALHVSSCNAPSYDFIYLFISCLPPLPTALQRCWSHSFLVQIVWSNEQPSDIIEYFSYSFCYSEDLKHKRTASNAEEDYLGIFVT